MSARDVNQALYLALKNDATLTSLGVTGVFDSQAPESQPLPVVVFQKSDGEHAYTFTSRAWQNHNYLVKGIASGNKDLAERIDNRCYQILNLTKPSLANGFVMDLRRETDVSYGEDKSGTTYWHVGGQYKVMVRDA
jgi:uncharacterized protein DUF3168